MERKHRLDLGGGEDASEAAKRARPDAGPSGAGVNPYTGRPYTQRYYDILKTRQS